MCRCGYLTYVCNGLYVQWQRVWYVCGMCVLVCGRLSAVTFPQIFSSFPNNGITVCPIFNQMTDYPIPERERVRECVCVCVCVCVSVCLFVCA